MTVQQSLGFVAELQDAVSKVLQDQLQVLKEARKQHSHSDLLLPPDLVSSVLEAGIIHLKSLVQSFTQQVSVDLKGIEDIKPVITLLFNVEARKLVFQALQGGQGEEELDRTAAKDLFDRLDVVLELEEHDLLDTALPLLVIEEVLERLTIEACSLQFNYIELRTRSLTRNLQPGKGKGLTLLRTCNELIRRLSRPTRQHTVFAGRVLSLLSSVFPLGERSGVNSRGDFNVDNKTVWVDVAEEEGTTDEKDVEQIDSAIAEDEEKAEIEKGEQILDKKALDEKAKEERKLRDEEMIKSIQDSKFYILFWKVQAWFANPALLFATKDEQEIVFPPGVEDPVQNGTKSSFRSFRMATRRILDVFGAVERKEKELVGKAGDAKVESEIHSIHSNGTKEYPEAGSQLDGTIQKKRKLDVEDEEIGDEDKDEESFFPKYLTGRNLFEYELRDATFRKHVLAQFLILFQYLLSFSQKQREKAKEWKNQVIAQSTINFALDDTDDRWIRDTWKEIVYLVREIPPEGKKFSDSILQVLKREARWINWKSDNCPAIDKLILSDDQIAAFAKARKALLLPMRKYPHTVGTAALSRLWEDGVRRPEPMMRTIENEEGIEVQVQTDGLDELEFGPTIPSLESYASQIVKLEQQQDARRTELGWEAPSVYHVAINMPQDKRQNERKRIAREANDEKLKGLEESRILHAWRASRLARATHLDRFSKMKIEEGNNAVGIRIDDITRLMKAVQDKSKKAEASKPSSIRATSVSAESSKKEGDVEMKDANTVASVDSDMARLVKSEAEIPSETAPEESVKEKILQAPEEGSTADEAQPEEDQDKDTTMQS